MTLLANRSQKDDSTNSNVEPQESTSLNSRESVIRRLRRSKGTRSKFVESHVNKTVAFQIRSLRGDLTQEQMTEKVGMNQNAISRLENPYYGKPTLTTLKRIAAAFDVGLVVEFVPFSKLANKISGTPFEERGLSPESLNVPSFTEEDNLGVFKNNEANEPVFTTSEAIAVAFPEDTRRWLFTEGYADLSIENSIFVQFKGLPVTEPNVTTEYQTVQEPKKLKVVLGSTFDKSDFQGLFPIPENTPTGAFLNG